MPDPNVQHTARSGVLSAADFRDGVSREDITTVLLAVPDMMGRLKGKRLGAGRFLETMESQEMCAYVLATDVDMNPLTGFELTDWEEGYGDIRVLPDMDTIRRLPYPGTVLIHADAAHADGTFVDVAPRRMLRTQLARMARLGMNVRVGLESEFVLYRGGQRHAQAAGYRGLKPVGLHNGDYSLDHPPELMQFFLDLEDALSTAGTPVEAVKTEGARGQIEVTFPYGEALRACDAYTAYKHIVKHLAEQHRMTPTFMAVPETGVGSGLHIHLSLWFDDRNAFACQSGQDLPESMKQAIAGLVTAMPHLGPLYAPTVNSYNRFLPHSFAPTRFSWGHDNRGCAFRVTGHGEGTHLEIRLPPANANPYLALAASLAAIHHGLTNDLKPPPPCEGEPYEDSDALPVPGTLAEAVADFDASSLAQEAFGGAAVRHYAHAARAEVYAHRGQVGDVELERGFLRD